jgi:uncharacterized membrane protein YfcA
MVPFLYFLFEVPAFSGVVVPLEEQAVVAHATSLLVIVPTAVSGLRAYRKAGLVDWHLVLPMAAGAMLAAVGGALLAEHLPGAVLKVAFGLFLLATGLRLLRPGRREDGSVDEGRHHGRVTYAASGAAVGAFSALLGVGGGLVAIPILIYVVHLELRRVAATSLGLVVFAAVSGTVTYAVAGWDTPGLPGGTWGYVFLPAALALAPGAVVGARWGAALNQRMDARLLRLTFAVLFLAIGVRILLRAGGAVVP